MKVFSNRTIGFWIGFAASVLMLAGDAAFIATDRADRTFSFLTFGLILAGVACQALVVVFDWKVMPLLCAVCFGSALLSPVFRLTYALRCGQRRKLHRRQSHCRGGVRRDIRRRHSAYAVCQLHEPA